MERVIIRIENQKGFYEYGMPILIFIDAIDKGNGFVTYCSATGHGEGDYTAILKQTRPITDEEIENLWFYGYKLKDFKLVKKFVRK